MALLNPQQIALAGTAPTYVAATATTGDSVTPDDRCFFHVKNGSGSPINVTVVVPGSAYGQARPDIVLPIAAGGDKFVGPMVADLADPTDGQIDLICSAVTSVTIAAVRI